MGTGRAAGEDGFVAELLKFGGSKLRKKVFKIVQDMWTRATEANEGEEGQGWPEEWNVGVVIPLWKRKGKKTD